MISQFFWYGEQGTVTTPPLIVYLDTQDYIRLFNEPDGGKLVAKFTDLPARIEARLCYRGE